MVKRDLMRPWRLLSIKVELLNQCGFCQNLLNEHCQIKLGGRNHVLNGYNYSTSWLIWDLTSTGEKGARQFCDAVVAAVDRQRVFCLVSCCKQLLVYCHVAVVLHQTTLTGHLIWMHTVKRLEYGCYLKSQPLKAQAVGDSCMVKVRLTLEWQLNCCWLLNMANCSDLLNTSYHLHLRLNSWPLQEVGQL